jgi:hypothetical protein
VTIGLGAAPHADAAITGAPEKILALLTGRMSLAAARAAGVEIDADPSIQARLIPAPAAGA